MRISRRCSSSRAQKSPIFSSTASTCVMRVNIYLRNMALLKITVYLRDMADFPFVRKVLLASLGDDPPAISALAAHGETQGRFARGGTVLRRRGAQGHSGVPADQDRPRDRD